MRIKNWLAIFIMTLLLTASGGTPVLADESGAIQVVVNGGTLLLNSQPITENSRTLVPFRPILESLGASVQWIAETKTIVATKEDTTITLQLNNISAQVNGAIVKLDVTAKVVNNQTFVPLRFVGEALGADVFYEAKSKTIYISEDYYGNLPSNQINDGKVLPAADGYYISQSNGLMKYDANTDKKTMLLYSYVEGLNKVGDYLYFTNINGINRFNVKTSQLDLLQDDTGDLVGDDCVTLYDNWIYYIGNGDSICRIRLDGTSHSVLNTMGANGFFIYADKIYFGNGADDCKVYYMDLTGKNVKKVCDIKGSYALIGVGYGGWIYFTAEPQYVTNLYQMKPDGSELKMLMEDTNGFGLYAGKLIFSEQEYEFYNKNNEYTTESFYNIFSMDLSNKKVAEIFNGDGFFTGINFADAGGFYFDILQGGMERTFVTAEGLYYYEYGKSGIEFIDPRPEYPLTY